MPHFKLQSTFFFKFAQIFAIYISDVEKKRVPHSTSRYVSKCFSLTVTLIHFDSKITCMSLGTEKTDFKKEFHFKKSPSILQRKVEKKPLTINDSIRFRLYFPFCDKLVKTISA